MANQITRCEPATLISITSNNQPVTTSLLVAEAFGKRHDDVLRKLRVLECSEEFNARNFALVKYMDGKGESRPMYQMTKDGFMFLVMGFTGKKAAQVKELYINAFNQMEAELRETDPALVDSILNNTIGTDGFRCLGVILDGKVKHLEPALRTRAKQHIWSQVHKAFSVVSAQDIPAGSLDAVRNFIGAYALEGEYLPKQQRAPFPEEKIAYLATWNKIAYHRYRQLDDLSKQLNDLAKKVEAVKSNLYDPIAEPSMSLTPYVDQDRVERLLDMQDRRRS